MARTALLALLCLSGIASCCAAPGFRTWIRFSSGGDEPAEPSCLTYVHQDSCLEHACGWCSSSVVGDLGCVSEGLAKLVPQALAECKLNEDPADDADDEDEDAEDEDAELQADQPDKPKPKPPTSCGDNKERRDCLKLGAEEGDCAWCEGDFMPASCVGIKAAEWIPEQVAKCKMPKKHKKDDADLAADKPEKPKPKPPTSCGDNKERRDCLKLGAEEGDCAWCEGDFMPASCVGIKAAEWIPEQVAKCKMPKKHKKDDADLAADKPDKPKPPTSCGDNKERRDCLKLGAEEGDCAWCEGDFMPASCVGIKAAEWIPEQVAKCRMPKKHKEVDSVSADDSNKKHKKKTAATCMEIKDSRECVRKGADEGECAWCAGKFLPDGCIGVDKAKFIPEQVATCKMPKHDTEGDVDDNELAAATSLDRKHHKKGGTSGGGGGWIPGGGDWPSGGGDYPSGGGDYPGPGDGGYGPGGGGQGQGCMALKSKKKCLRGTDTEACAWCGTSSLLGSPCVSESTAKYMPSFITKCKMGKGPKKNDAEKVAVA